MPTKTINDLTATADILDADELAFWNVANARTDKITYAELKTDLFGGLSGDTEILFNNAGNIDGDPRLLYNQGTNTMTLGGTFNLKSTTAPAPASPVDSPDFILTSQYDDGASDKDTDWKTFISATDDAGTSLYIIQTQIDGAGYTDIITINSFGVMTLKADSQPQLILQDTNNTINQTGYRASFRMQDSNSVVVGNIGFGSSDLHMQIQTNRTGGRLELKTESADRWFVLNTGVLQSQGFNLDMNANDIDNVGNITFNEIADPGTPAVNTSFLYMDSTDEGLYYENNAGPRVRLDVLSGIGGSITDDQVAVGATAANDIEGTAGLIYNGSALLVTGSVTANTVSDAVKFRADTDGTNDVFLELAVGSTRAYAWGIDNDASDTMKLTTAAASSVIPSSGTELVSITSAGVFRIHAGNLVISTHDIVTDTTTGTKIATGATQKIGFWDATPVVQPAHIVDADGTLADITTKFNTLLAQVAATGMQASS